MVESRVIKLLIAMRRKSELLSNKGFDEKDAVHAAFYAGQEEGLNFAIKCLTNEKYLTKEWERYLNGDED